NWRFFRSRSGHLMKFDDTSGAERIEIVGKGGGHKLVIDVSGKKIEISCSSGDVAVSAPAGKISLDAKEVEIKSKTTMTIEATGSLTIKGSTVAIN
ncbi:MAG: phage tail protein, partial [Acidobacteria bacterium]